MNLFESILEEVLEEAVVKVRHATVRVKHQSAKARSKSKKYRVKNKMRLKKRMLKLKKKLKSRPKPKAGYHWSASGKLTKSQKRVGVRKH